ncbi:MAG: hypothetical protein BWY42_01206 [Candidatus Omnitrophica bacterium ADurb.Bin277]|nr:MAG: hypothetical protein BWY42_01206 [Candidatus Omnitrophica bacterium ADurb.Bin277]
MRVFFLAVIFLSAVLGPSWAADFDRKDYEARTSSGGHSYGSGKHSSAKASVTRETEVFRPEPTKLTVVDATPVDPGHIEWVNTYSITGSKKQWRTNGRRTKRKFLREHGFETQANIGVFNGFDFGITQGFAYLLDKENNYDETGGAADADGESPDETDGPHRGHGRTDLILNGRWRFYQSCDETLRVAYIPSITIPIGRRSNLDHLGPSQGYVSMGNTLAVTKDMNRWTMSGNAGYEVPIAHKARRENYAGTLTLAAGAGYHVFDWLQPQVEVIYEHDFEQSGKGSKLVSMVFGAIIPVNDHLRLDLGVVQGIAGSNADQTTSGVFKLVLLT